MVYAGMLGLGTVGTCVARYLYEHREDAELTKALIQDPSKQRDAYVPTTTDAYEILDDPRIGIVIEVMGGEEPALEYMMQAMRNGKSVVTANKLVIARYGRELFDEARRNGVDVAYEASVGGGIPIIRTLRESLNANEIRKMYGIVNGTTNYILTRMGEDMDYETALKIAQEKGFAERDPTSDVSGMDAAYKLAVLAGTAYNVAVNPDHIYREGVEKISPEDIQYAKEFGYAIKLLAIAKKDGDSLDLRVHPALISSSHDLAPVSDEFNAIYVDGDMAGPQTYKGRGAGSKPTASAVVSDIRHVARNIRNRICDDIPSSYSSMELVDMNDIVTSGYLRVNLKNVPGTFAGVARVLGDNGISIGDSIQRRQFAFTAGGEEIMPDIITTYPTTEGAVQKALKELSGLEGVYGEPFYLRIEE